jgi:ZIP family zinc transporter
MLVAVFISNLPEAIAGTTGMRAGGAILMVLANSMIPESYEHGGKVTGLLMVLGFFVSVAMVIMENF